MYKISKAGLHNVMIGTNTGYSIGDIGLSYSLASLTSRPSLRTYKTIILGYLPPNPLRIEQLKSQWPSHIIILSCQLHEAW